MPRVSHKVTPAQSCGTTRKAVISDRYAKAVARTRAVPVARKMILRGKGAYSGNTGRAAGLAAGSVIGSKFGPMGKMVGGWLGSKLGYGVERGISRLLGKGAYNVKSNSLMNVGPATAEFSINKFGSVDICHREFVGDVLSSNAFNLQSWDVNPCNPRLHAWLAPQANQYEKYRLKGMVMQYVPVSSMISSSQAAGVVIMATEYDVAKPDFASKVQMMNTEFSTSGAPTKEMVHPIECDRTESVSTVLYTWSVQATANGIPSGTDPHLYNFGNFQVAVSGCPTSGEVIGEIYCAYHYELITPRPASTAVGVTSQLHYDLLSTSPPTSVALFGALQGQRLRTSIFGRLTPANVYFNSTGTTLQLSDMPGGTIYQITIVYEGTSATLGAFGSTLLGATLYNYYKDNTMSSQLVPVAGTATTRVAYQVCFQQALAGTSCQLQLSTAVIPTALSGADLDIQVLNPYNPPAFSSLHPSIDEIEDLRITDASNSAVAVRLREQLEQEHMRIELDEDDTEELLHEDDYFDDTASQAARRSVSRSIRPRRV